MTCIKEIKNQIFIFKRFRNFTNIGSIQKETIENINVDLKYIII